MPLEFDATPEDLQLFLQDSEDQLQILNDDLVRLEREGDNGELLQEIFRAAHTLKGSSATLGHQRMADLTHATESVLDALRQRQLTVTPEIVDALLESLDGLEILNQEVATLEQSDYDPAPLAARLRAIATVEGQQTTPTEEAATPTPAAGPVAFDLDEEERARVIAATGEEQSALAITVTLEETEWQAVRALQVLMESASIGTVVQSVPSQEAIESDQVGQTVQVLLLTQEPAERVQAVVQAIPDLREVTVRPWEPAPAIPAEELPVRQRQMPAPIQAADRGPDAAGQGQSRRLIDLGPEARGMPQRDQLRLAGQRLARATQMIKVDVARLDQLMNLVGELVIDRTRLIQLGTRLETIFPSETSVQDLSEVALHIGRVTDELQEEVMRSRMLPVEQVFNRLPRMVRDLARQLGKQVNLVIEGQDTEVDRSVIDEIGDPLIHIVRNSVDHGLESPDERAAAGKPAEGTVRVTAAQEEGYIVIAVSDDGRGIDPRQVREAAVHKGVVSAEAAERMSDKEAVNLVFAPGFSTAAQVTAVSGRGVGMDIVRTNIQRLNGAIDLDTKVGEGTTTSLKLPLTLAIVRGLLVRVAPRAGGRAPCIVALPLTGVVETLRVDPAMVHRVRGAAVIQVREKVLPLLPLGEVLDGHYDTYLALNGPAAETNGTGAAETLVVVVRSGTREVGLVVDSLVGEQEIVIKSLGSYLGEITGISGAAILGDGRVALIVDVPTLLSEAVRHTAVAPRRRERGADMPARASGGAAVPA